MGFERVLVWVPSGRPGGDLLSRVLGRSTIGAEGFHGRVRDGIGCWAPRRNHQVVETEFGGQRSEDGEQEKKALSFLCPLSSDLCPLGNMSTVVSQVEALVYDASSESLLAACEAGYWIKPNERLVPVSFTHCCASTAGLSTWWSSTALRGELVLRGVSRLDAFSGYPDRT